MSRTLKHRIEGLYHHGLIPLKDVPRGVMKGWDRHNYGKGVSITSGHAKAVKLNRIRQEAEISDLQDTTLYKTI